MRRRGSASDGWGLPALMAAFLIACLATLAGQDHDRQRVERVRSGRGSIVDLSIEDLRQIIREECNRGRGP